MANYLVLEMDSFFTGFLLKMRKCLSGRLILMMVSTRAAYKGYADTIRLLLFRDACQGRQDREGISTRILLDFKYFEIFNSSTPLESIDCDHDRHYLMLMYYLSFLAFLSLFPVKILLMHYLSFLAFSNSFLVKKMNNFHYTSKEPC